MIDWFKVSCVLYVLGMLSSLLFVIKASENREPKRPKSSKIFIVIFLWPLFNTIILVKVLIAAIEAMWAKR